MISTVTTSTVSTVTTVALAGGAALIGILVLLALLIQKEIATSGGSNRLTKLGQALNIGIIPLVIAFLAIVATRVSAILR
jgi:hypothetical protein